MPFFLIAIVCFIVASFNGRGWGHNIRATAIGFIATLGIILVIMATTMHPPS